MNIKKRKIPLIILAVALGAICLGIFLTQSSSNSEVGDAASVATDNALASGENWPKRCNMNKCEIVQMSYIKKDNKDVKFIELAISKKSSKEAVLGLSVPLGISLQEGIILDVNTEDKEAIQIPMKSCYSSGCVAVANLSANFLRDMSNGKNLIVILTTTQGERLKASVPLSGFAKSFEAL